MVVDGKTGVSQGSFLGPTLIQLYINDLSDQVISNIAISADDATFYCMNYKSSHLLHHLDLAFQLESTDL